jgi:hypothetical protein
VQLGQKPDAEASQLTGTKRRNLLVHSSSNSDLPSNTAQWTLSTSLAFPLHFLADLPQFSTAPILSVQSVLSLNQKFRTQWKAVGGAVQLSALDPLMDFWVAHLSG